MFEAYSELQVNVSLPATPVVELELLTDEQYNDLVNSTKDPSKLLKAIHSVELHTQYGVVVLLQRAVELFAQRTGKHQTNEYELTTGQSDIVNNILPELFRNNFDKRALTNRIRLAKIDPNLLFLMVLLLVRTKRSKGEHLEASLLGWINALYNAFFLRMHLDSNLQQTVVLLHDEVSRQLEFDSLAEELLAELEEIQAKEQQLAAKPNNPSDVAYVPYSL